MIRGTTPDLILTLPVDLTDCTVYVTLGRKPRLVTKTGEDLVVTPGATSSTIEVWFTQEDTLSLREGQAEIQVRFIDSEDKAYATNCKNVVIGKVLLEGVINYVAEG